VTIAAALISDPHQIREKACALSNQRRLRVL